MEHNHFLENLLLSASIVKIDLKPLSTSPNGHTPGILSIYCAGRGGGAWVVWEIYRFPVGVGIEG